LKLDIKGVVVVIPCDKRSQNIRFMKSCCFSCWNSDWWRKKFLWFLKGSVGLFIPFVKKV